MGYGPPAPGNATLLAHARGSGRSGEVRLFSELDEKNDRYGRYAIGFGLFPPDLLAFKGTQRLTGCGKNGSFSLARASRVLGRCRGPASSKNRLMRPVPM
jgi:hypothetical protein